MSETPLDFETLIVELETTITLDDFSVYCSDFIERIENRDDAQDAIGPILKLMERHPDADFGVPGSLVHFVEKYYGRGYEEQLVESVERKITTHTEFMLKRVINADSSLDSGLIDVNTERKLRIEELKRITRRNGLSRDLSSVVSSTVPFLPVVANTAFCDQLFLLLSEQPGKFQIYGVDDVERASRSMAYVRKAVADMCLVSKSARLIATNGRELEAVTVDTALLRVYLDDVVDSINFKSGRNDFMLVTDDLQAGVAIERTEYCYEFSSWGLGARSPMRHNLIPNSDLPDGFVYPSSYLRILELGLLDFDVWWIIDIDELIPRYKGLQERYPDRELIPFARRGDNDDVACFVPGKEGVQIIHDFASAGWEQRKYYDDFWTWFRLAIDEMIEFE